MTEREGARLLTGGPSDEGGAGSIPAASAAAPIGDGLDTTVTLDCGCFFRLRGDVAPQYKVGHYTSCTHHSAVHSYDPDFGTPNFSRDRLVVKVVRDAE